MDRLVLWIAQGFGLGRIPVAPGTFGSGLGLLWAAALLGLGSRWLYLAGTVAGLACSVWLCERAERILGRTDPGSGVLAEIAAIPACLAVLLLLSAPRLCPWPRTVFQL